MNVGKNHEGLGKRQFNVTFFRLLDDLLVDFLPTLRDYRLRIVKPALIFRSLINVDRLVHYGWQCMEWSFELLDH